jgi:hypothetical protein
MIDKVEDIIKGLQKVGSPMMSEVFDNSSIQAQSIDRNQFQLYEQGINADEESLGQYAYSTIEYKTRIAGGLGNDTRNDHVTLKDTGDFYRSMKFEKDDESFWISGDADKGGHDLTRMYGNILGLTADSLDYLREEIVERFQDKIWEEIT